MSRQTNISRTIVQQENGKYRMVIERAASTKGVLGYKVEANSDNIDHVAEDITILKMQAERIAGATPEAVV